MAISLHKAELIGAFLETMCYGALDISYFASIGVIDSCNARPQGATC